MAEQEPQKKKKEKKSVSRGGRTNALVILVCIDLIGFMASLYSLKAFSDANLFLIPAALTLVMSVITAMVYVQTLQQDEDDRQRVAGDVADALSAIVEITKSDQQLMDKKIDDLTEEYQVPAQEIINAVKALAKVSLGRSKENATALINSNEAVVTQVMDLQDKIDALEKKADSLSGSDLSRALDDHSHKVEVSLDDLIHDVQRLDQDVRRLEKVTKDLEMRPPVIQGVQVQQQAQPVSAESVKQEYQPEPEPVQETEEEPAEEPLTDETTTDETTEDEDLNLDLDIPSEPVIDEGAVAEEDVTDDITSEPQPEAAPVQETRDGSEALTEKKPESVVEETNAAEPSEETVTASEEPSPKSEETAEPQATPEPAVPEPASAPAPAIDMSDPNKPLSPDEIAALFAAAGNNNSAPEPELADEEQNDTAQTDSDTDDTASNNDTASTEDNDADTSSESGQDGSQAESDQPAASGPQVSGDPNRMMTPEEIEALFSSVS